MHVISDEKSKRERSAQRATGNAQADNSAQLDVLVPPTVNNFTQPIVTEAIVPKYDEPVDNSCDESSRSDDSPLRLSPPSSPHTSRRLLACPSRQCISSPDDESDYGGQTEGTVKINMPPVVVNKSPKFPKEPHKTILSLVLLMVTATCNDFVLAYIHDRVPNTKPLPDVFFDHAPYYPWALVTSEYFILASIILTFGLCFFHKYRWIVFRRLFMICALIYLLRCFTLLVTQVPVADPKYYCSPKLNHTDTWTILSRGLSLVSGVGLKINGKHTYCGDYIFSGHTVVLVMSYLIIKEYSPRRWWIVHWGVWLSSLCGVLCILLSRGHYSVDVIIAYYITTRLFWLYHTMASNTNLKEASQTNLLSRTFWFPLFVYLEEGITQPVPRRFGCPLSIPRLPRISPRTSKSNLQ